MTISRRSFLQGCTVGLGALQYACSNSDPGPGDPAAPGAPGLAPDVVALPPPDPIAHALKRLSFGVAQADYARALELGIAAYVDEQLTIPALPDPVELQAIATYPVAVLPGSLLLASPETTVPQATIQLRAKTLYLQTYSPRQLYEVLVDFWTNHFNIPNDVDQLGGYKAVDDNEVIRPNALSTFRTLLHASAKSSAMIVYLDNMSNTKDGPNENYARELMELHTLGRDGGYTEQDIKEVARCFTGWRVNATTKAFEFLVDQHDDGAKTVLGQQIPAGGGQADGERVLDILASHPSTARFVATKLARRFVDDVPPEFLVAQLASVFLASDGSVPALMRALVDSADFQASADRKFQRPIEFVAGAIRALNPDPGTYHGPDAMVAVTRMGHAPHGWNPPDGYPDLARYWTSTTGLLERWNFASGLAETRNGQGKSAVAGLVGTSQSAAGLVDLLAQRLVRRPLLAADRDALARAAGDGNPSAELTGDVLIDRAEFVAGQLLASPYFVLR